MKRYYLKKLIYLQYHFTLYILSTVKSSITSQLVTSV